MTKLKLEELAAYLPYKVMCLNQHLPDVEFVSEELIGIENYIVWSGVFNAKHGSNHVPVSAIKPLLLPLSSLTKEIEHNGERFVPFDYFNDDTENDWFDGNVWMNYMFEGDMNKTDLRFIPFYVVQKLLSWHIDIFNLISRGLAISK